LVYLPGGGGFIGLQNYPYTPTIWVRGAVGGEKIWFATSSTGTSFVSPHGATKPFTLTTQWQKISLPYVGLDATQFIELGVDLRDGSQTAQAAQTVYIWMRN